MLCFITFFQPSSFFNISITSNNFFADLSLSADFSLSTGSFMVSLTLSLYSLYLFVHVHYLLFATLILKTTLNSFFLSFNVYMETFIFTIISYFYIYFNVYAKIRVETTIYVTGYSKSFRFYGEIFYSMIFFDKL